jgi:RimJ/RimL family protein N-acetyltransferase
MKTYAIDDKVIEVPYETEDVTLGLFWEGKGSPFPETTLVQLYAQTKDEGLLERSFTGFGKDSTLNKFVSYLTGKPIVIGFDKKNNNLVGFGYLAEVEIAGKWKKASAGYVFFREYWGKQHIRDLARMTLLHWFVALDVNVLYGSMVATNRLAYRFATEELGFEMIGQLPKFFVTSEGMKDGIMVVLERDKYLSKFGG